jgi:mono/diheme cytochrome c family protein
VPLACATEQANSTGQEGGTNAAAEATQSAGANSGDGEKYYDVDCNQVDEEGNDICLTDRGTYVGWRTFHATCHACHGQNAVGTSFAPSLMKQIDRERFFDVVENGYTGQIGVMPPWGENPNVKDFIDELYAYQQARADGVLKPGRPVRKD